MLQTNSNQPFIFSSPRLREQIGASFEITLLSQWVKETAFDMELPSMSTSEEGKKAALHNWGCSWGLNPPVSRRQRVM